MSQTIDASIGVTEMFRKGCGLVPRLRWVVESASSSPGEEGDGGVGSRMRSIGWRRDV